MCFRFSIALLDVVNNGVFHAFHVDYKWAHHHLANKVQWADCRWSIGRAAVETIMPIMSSDTNTTNTSVDQNANSVSDLA